MAITYGGQELVQPSAAVLEWAERMLDVGGPWDTPPHIPRGGAALQRLPHVQNAPTDEPGVNILCWPRGASRYAYGHFIIHETQLAVVRAEAYAGGSYNALQFIFSDGIRSVSPYLYMLPPRPIVVPDASEFLPGLYLITLVDHRYFWHYKGVAGTALDTTTWSSLYSSIGTALGVTITADSVHSEYSVPPDSFAIGYQSLPALLDAVASSCGHVIVRTLEGDVLAMNADTSGVRLTDNVTATALTVRLAGGIIGFDTSDRASVIPSSVTVCFGRLDEAGEPYAKEVTLASLSLINYSTTIPFVGTKILYHPTRADYHGGVADPYNQADLDLIANRMAIDWYKFRFGRFEARLEGAIAWPMEGHTDRVYFDHSREAITTCGVTTRLAIPPWLEPTSDCGEDPFTHRRVIYVLVTGPVDGDGYYPCQPSEWDEPNQVWIDYDAALTFGANGEALDEDVRYISIKADDNEDGVEVFVASAPVGGTLTVSTLTGVGFPVTSVSPTNTLYFDPQTGLRVATPGTGVATVSNADASYTVVGVVNLTTQTFAGFKFLADGAKVGDGPSGSGYFEVSCTQHVTDPTPAAIPGTGSTTQGLIYCQQHYPGADPGPALIHNISHIWSYEPLGTPKTVEVGVSMGGRAGSDVAGNAAGAITFYRNVTGSATAGYPEIRLAQTNSPIDDTDFAVAGFTYLKGDTGTFLGMVFQSGLLVDGSGAAGAWADITGIPDSIDAIAVLTPIAGTFAYYTSSTTAALATLTALGLALAGAADQGAAQAAIGVGAIYNRVFGP